MWTQHQSRAFSVLVPLVLASCGGGDSSPTPTPTQPSAPQAATLQVLGGNSQSSVVGSELGQALQVRVGDQNGNAFAGATVSWAVVSGAGTLSVATSTTGSDGTASVTWTLGTVAGQQSVTASVSGVSASATFTATATPGEPTEMVLSSEAVTLGAWGETMTLEVSGVDAFGNEITSPSVTWSSSNADVATVSVAGLVTTRFAGEATILATSVSPLATQGRAGEPAGLMASASVSITVGQLNTACTAQAPQVAGATGSSQPFVLGPEGLPISMNPWDGNTFRTLDFDGDGDDDLIRFEYSFPNSAVYSGALTVIENQDGVLVEATDDWIDTPIVPDHPRDYEIWDFDGDGREEIFVAQHGFDAVPFPGAPTLLLEVVGDKLVDSGATAVVPNDANGFTHGAAAADIDCDGDRDVFVVTATEEAPSRLFSNAGGVFSDASGQMPTQLLTGGFQETEFIDFDLDGDPDLFMGPLSTGGADQANPALLINDGFGNFRRSEQITLPAPHYTSSHAINAAKAADFTGDGRPDLIFFEIPAPFSPISVIRLWENAGDGTFNDIGVEWGLPAECTGEVIEPLFVDDFNGDGWADFIIPLGCQETGGAPSIAINTGTGFQITTVTSFRPWFEFAQPYPLDIDSDGDLDLFLDQNGGPVILRNTTIGG